MFFVQYGTIPRWIVFLWHGSPSTTDPRQASCEWVWSGRLRVARKLVHGHVEMGWTKGLRRNAFRLLFIWVNFSFERKHLSKEHSWKVLLSWCQRTIWIVFNGMLKEKTKNPRFSTFDVVLVWDVSRVVVAKAVTCSDFEAAQFACLCSEQSPSHHLHLIWIFKPDSYTYDPWPRVKTALPQIWFVGNVHAAHKKLILVSELVFERRR